MALGKGYVINSRKGRTDVNCGSESSVRKGWSDRVKDPVQRLYPILKFQAIRKTMMNILSRLGRIETFLLWQVLQSMNHFSKRL